MSLPLSTVDKRSSSISSSVLVILLLVVVIPRLFAIDLVIGYEEIRYYFDAIPYINGIILLTLIIGFLLYSFKIFALSSEFRFMNSVAFGKLKLNDSSLNLSLIHI